MIKPLTTKGKSMKANDVIALANQAASARRSMTYHWNSMTAIDEATDPKGKEQALRAFLRKKEQFATIMDAIHIVSRGAGSEFRMEGWNRDDS